MMQSILRRFLTCVCLLFATVSTTAQGEDNELVIITPHNLQIQEEFETGFSEHIGAPAQIRWIKQGTSELLQMLETLERNKSGESFGFDLFFGGGPADHLLAANRGYSQPAALDSTLLAAIPERVAGFELYDKERRWCATALSSFGILLNQQVLKRQGLPALETWKDLADPVMQSWVVIADPRKSSSVQVCYEAVIQQYGWEEGWPVLMQIAANSRFIADSSGGVPNEIAVGSAQAAESGTGGSVHELRDQPGRSETVDVAGGSAGRSETASTLSHAGARRCLRGHAGRLQAGKLPEDATGQRAGVVQSGAAAGAQPGAGGVDGCDVDRSA